MSLYLVIIIGKDFTLDSINGTYNNLTAKNGIIAAVSTLVTFVLNGLLSSNLKATLVFWRIRNVLPGCRVFSDLINKDCRIDKAVLTKKYGNLPVQPDEQNKLWYKIFKTNEYDSMIFDSHRNFLLSRDLTGLGFLFLIIYSVALFASDATLKTVSLYIGFLLAQYIILAIVSQNYGKRFACNVLAKACIK